MTGICSRFLRLPPRTAQWFKVSRSYKSQRVCSLMPHGRFLQRRQTDQTVLSLRQVPLPCTLHPAMFTARRYKHSSSSKDEKEFTAFYHFPYIASMKFFSRLKLSQTLVTVGCIPVLYLGEYYEIIQPVDKSLTIMLAALALSMLYALGEFFRRLIGIMYLNRDGTMVKLSHLTFWGKRKDLIVPVADIIPLRDCGEEKDAIAKVRRYSTNKYLLISTRFGRILNQELFETVFGSIYQDQSDP